MIFNVSTRIGDREEVLECSGNIEDIKCLVLRSIAAMTPEEKAEVRRALEEEFLPKLE